MKKLFSLLLILSLLVTVIPLAGADEYIMGTARVTFNIRHEPSTDSTIRANVKQGSQVRILEGDYNDVWVKVKYNSATGYAKSEWLKVSAWEKAKKAAGATATPVPEKTASSGGSDETKATATPEPEATATPEPTGAPGDGTANDSDYKYTGDLEVDNTLFTTASLKNIEFAQQANLDATATDLLADVDLTGLSHISVGESETDEIAYEAMTLKTFNIRSEPNETSRKLYEVKKGSDIRVIAYGDDWCKVQSMNGKYTGYCKTSYLFHFHSFNRFKWEVPGWSTYTMTGYVIMKAAGAHVQDSKNSYGGWDLNVGDILCVQSDDGTDLKLQIRREWDDSLTADQVEFHAFVNWREAKAGDVIGGYTQYVGKTQGGAAYYKNRKSNIANAMSFMDGTVINVGEEYSFLTNIGPINAHNGYKTARVTGGAGKGTGGGICHTSSLMYEASLSIPLLITEREPHTNEGNDYCPLEFDATVGSYSDFCFINTLPYPIKMHAFMDRSGMIITVLFECTETVDADTLQNWDGSTLNIDWTTYHD